MKQYLLFLTLFTSLLTSAQSQNQTENLIFDNNKFIYFRNPQDSTDNTRVGRYGGGSLRIKSAANVYFDALNNNPVIFTDMDETAKARIHPNGDSFFNGGNIGIGTSSPLGDLHIKRGMPNAIGPQLLLQNSQYDNSAGAGSLIKFFGNNQNRNISMRGIMRGYGQADRLEFLFQDNDDIVNTMTLTHEGKVGIGVVDPAYPLDVNGGGRFTERLDLGVESTGGLNFGNSWNAYSNTGADSYILTHAGSGGAELEIKNVDGTVGNSVAIFKGKVGIGVGAPNYKLEVNGNIGIHNGDAVFQVGPANNSTTGVSIRSINNPANQDNIFTVESSGSSSRFGVTQAHGAWIKNGLHIGTQFDSDMPDLERGLIVDGKVAIGTTLVPSEYELAVKGRAIMEEVRVELSGAWPDYVFESDYNLRSLADTEEYIKANKHLPEVPSAEEVKENGILLGEMNALLLKKIEELTLHVIELKKEVDRLKED